MDKMDPQLERQLQALLQINGNLAILKATFGV
jgi:hypothetical protein